MDNNPATTTIAASDVALYQMHGDGTIWTYTGSAASTPRRIGLRCTGCTGPKFPNFLADRPLVRWAS